MCVSIKSKTKRFSVEYSVRKQQSEVAISIYFLFEAELPVMSQGELNEAAVQFQWQVALPNKHIKIVTGSVIEFPF